MSKDVDEDIVVNCVHPVIGELLMEPVRLLPFIVDWVGVDLVGQYSIAVSANKRKVCLTDGISAGGGTDIWDDSMHDSLDGKTVDPDGFEGKDELWFIAVVIVGFLLG